MRMARERLHRRRRDSPSKERGDEVVAKVVQTKRLDACALARTRERLTKTPLAPRSPVLRSRDERVAIAVAHARERRLQLRRERDHPFMPRLRRRRLPPAHALANDELSAREIDVAPLESPDLPCPEPRVGSEQEGEPMARRGATARMRATSSSVSVFAIFAPAFGMGGSEGALSK